jgi:DNA repair exonuclease SbcCD nuclease subunit
MSFRFLHLADLHLETRFGGRPETCDRLRRATLEAFERAVDYAIESRLHAVLAAGDLFDDARLSTRTELFFVGQLKRLAEAGVWFLAACGNHDPGGAGFRTARLGDLGERVRFFREADPEQVTVCDRDGAEVGVVVGAGHSTDREAGNLAARFPRVTGSLPVVGLLHTSVESARAAARHERYAPSTAADYQRLDYAYWALGHIHVRQQAVPGLPVYYAGNLQGRDVGETGAKGGLVVEAFAGGSPQPEFVRFAPVRCEKLIENLSPAILSIDALATRLVEVVGSQPREEGEQLVLCIELTGETPLARTLRKGETLRALSEEVASRGSALEVELRAGGTTLPVDRARILASPSVLREALALIERAQNDDALLSELAPAVLASDEGADEKRLPYLKSLLAELPEELMQRSLVAEET